MSDVLQERIDDWTTWFLANQHRTHLYYRGIPQTAFQRQSFILQMQVGNLELSSLLIEQLTDIAVYKETPAVSDRLVDQIRTLTAHYHANVRGIEDPQKMWELLLYGQGKFLELFEAMHEAYTVLHGVSTKESVVEFVTK